MIDPSSVPKAAASASETVLNQSAAPCCAAGTAAFDASAEKLESEYAAMVAELSAASETLIDQSTAALNGWISVESQLQVAGASPAIVALVQTQLNAAKGAWAEAETSLAAQATLAAESIQAAEMTLSAEAGIFSTQCCEDSAAEAGNT